MRKRMRLLLASTMTVAGLVAGITPANAASKAQEDAVGVAFPLEDFEGSSIKLESPRFCQALPNRGRARSAKNTSTSTTIRLYAFQDFAGGCIDLLAVLVPQEVDDGIGTRLGIIGARYYTTTL